MQNILRSVSQAKIFLRDKYVLVTLLFFPDEPCSINLYDRGYVW
jgi:hypothetical protein